MATCKNAVSLTTVPVEILRTIFKPLKRDSLLNLRLTTRYLHKVASETLFTTITIRGGLRSSDQLTRVSSSPFWASQVRCIDWHSYASHLLGDKRSIERDSLLSTDGSVHTLEICQVLRNFVRAERLRLDLQVKNPGQEWPMFYLHDWNETLRLSNLRPRIIEVDPAILQVSYVENDRVHSLIVNSREDFSIESVGAVMLPGPGFRSFLISHKSTLRNLVLRDVELSVKSLDLVTGLLDRNGRLQELHIDNVMLQSERPYSSIFLFLEGIRRRKNIARIPSFHINLKDLGAPRSKGRLSASDGELTTWAAYVDEDGLRQAFYEWHHDEHSIDQFFKVW